MAGVWSTHTLAHTYYHKSTCVHAQTCVHLPRVLHPCTLTRTHCSFPLVSMLLSPDSICSFCLRLSNLSRPAKIFFLSPCGSARAHTHTPFQLSEEKQTENWVDKSKKLLTVKCFTRWFCSFFPPFLPSLPFFLCHFSWSLLMCHITQPQQSDCFFLSVCLSDKEAHSCKAAKGDCDSVGSNYQVCSINDVCVCACM